MDNFQVICLHLIASDLGTSQLIMNLICLSLDDKNALMVQTFAFQIIFSKIPQKAYFS